MSCGIGARALYRRVETSGQNMAETKSLKERILAHIVSEIPDELAPCEFDCPAQDCIEDDWRHCGNRLKMVEAIRACRKDDQCCSKQDQT